MSIKSFSIFLFVFFIWECSTGQAPVPLHPIREADVMWEKRIWRVIDLREKINLQLYYPLEAHSDSSGGVLGPSALKKSNRISLFQAIKNVLLKGELPAYSFNPVDLDDCFSVQLTKTELIGQLYSIDTVQDENGNSAQVRSELTPDKIRGYTIKEDWIFEKQRSSMEVRIIALCPRSITINKNTGKEDENAAPSSLFWIYYPAIAPLLARIPVFNEKNNAEERSLYSIFLKRQFSSYIIQESNVFNRTIAAYLKGIDAILESEKIHNKIFDIEHDMWQY